MAELGYLVGTLFCLVVGAVIVAWLVAVLGVAYHLFAWVARVAGYTFGACCHALERFVRDT